MSWSLLGDKGLRPSLTFCLFIIEYVYLQIITHQPHFGTELFVGCS